MTLPESAQEFLAGQSARVRNLNKKKRIVFPEGTDARVREAAARLAQEGLLEPVLLCPAADLGAGVVTIDPATDDRAGKYAALFFERRRAKGITHAEATQAARRPLYFGCLMVAADDADAFVAEIAPVSTVDAAGNSVSIARDEGIRRDSTLAKLSSLKPAFQATGLTTAGSSSQISDGAAAVLLASEAAVKRYGLKPRARVISLSTAGVDPTIMLTAPIGATRKALARAGVEVGQLHAVEINEAFASVALGCGRELGFDFDRVNVRGGAIALGHPLGASGARLMTTLLGVLESTGGRYGLQTMCIGFGQATATLIEAIG